MRKLGKFEEVADLMPKVNTRASGNLNPLPNILIAGHLLRLDEVEESAFK